MRTARRLLGAAVVGSLLAMVLPVVSASAAAPPFSLQPSMNCLASSYVRVTNDSGASADVKALVNSQQWGATLTIADGETDLVGIDAPLPATSGNVEVYQVGTPDVLIGTFPFSLDFCDDLQFTYDDHCTTIDVTIKNLSTTAYSVTFAQTSGATFPITSAIPVPAGQTVTTSITVTNTNLSDNTPQEWFEIGANVTVDGNLQYLSRYTIKGLDGDCEATTAPASQPASTETAGGALPKTGTAVPVATLLAAGASLLVLGLVGLLVARRWRRA